MLTKILALSLITGTAAFTNYSQSLNPEITNINSNQTIAQLPNPTQKEYTGIVKQIDDIADCITVRIAIADTPSYGSGVIIARNENTYYVATAGYMFPENSNNSYQIITPDEESHELDLKTVEKSNAYDVAIFSFTSEKNYDVATIGNYTVAANDDQIVFVSGFPHNQSSKRIITGGKAIQKDRASFSVKDAYSLIDNGEGLVYTNLSYRGMGGGAVLDSEGRLVGIGTGSENEIYVDESGNIDDYSLGYSLGVSVRDVIPFLEGETKLKTEWLQTNNDPAVEISDRSLNDIEAQLLTVEQPEDNADLVTWMNYGNQLWRYGRYSGAVAAFERVIAIAPDFDRAYYAMGLAYWKLQDYQQVVTALQQATQINPNTYFYWRYLGLSYAELERFDEAISAFQRAMALNDRDFVLYVSYGDVLKAAERYEEALASYNEALELNLQHPWIYNNRGLVYSDLEQWSNALADYNRALDLNPQFADAYYRRGHTHYKLDDISQTKKDWQQAIVLYEQQKQPEQAKNIRELLKEL